MDTTQTPDKQALAENLARAREALAALTRDRETIDAELAGLEPERQQHVLLGKACSALEALDAAGGTALFFDGPAAGASAHLDRVRARLGDFDRRFGEVQQRRESVLDQMRRQADEAGWLEDDLSEVQDAELELALEWEIEREVSETSRSLFLPWTRGGEDDQRFTRSLAAAFVVTMIFVLVAPLIDLPVPPPEEVPDVPERVVKLLEQKRPPAPPPVVRDQPKPKPVEQVAKREPVAAPKPVTPKEPVPEKAPEAPKGLLAFRDKLAAREEDSVVARLGANASIAKGGGAAGQPQRAMLTSQAPGSSGGINLASLSRGLGGDGGAGMAGVQAARASSAIQGIGAAGSDRPMSGASAKNSRTDEEIQIVFDRYKSALYRLYNRELRKDPALRGQMVLRLTIEADGTVSFCELHQTDMNAGELSAQVVDRVRTINFGAKEGISAITILYPIDFLPAA